MAQQPGLIILVIREQLARLHDLADGAHDFVCLLILNHTAVHRYYPVAVFLIDSGNNLLFGIDAEGRMALVAIAPRLLHPQNLVEARALLNIFLHQALDPFLLPCKLCIVGEVLQATTSANSKHLAPR